MNTEVLIFFWIGVSGFLGYIPRSGIVRSKGSSTLNFFEEPSHCWLHDFWWLHIIGTIKLGTKKCSKADLMKVSNTNFMIYIFSVKIQFWNYRKFKIDFPCRWSYIHKHLLYNVLKIFNVKNVKVAYIHVSLFKSKLFFYCCSGAVVSIFSPPLPSTPAIPTSPPQSYTPSALSMGPLYMFLDNPSYFSPHYPLLAPLWLLSVCSFFFFNTSKNLVSLFLISMSLVIFCLLVCFVD